MTKIGPISRIWGVFHLLRIGDPELFQTGQILLFDIRGDDADGAEEIPRPDFVRPDLGVDVAKLVFSYCFPQLQKRGWLFFLVEAEPIRSLFPGLLALEKDLVAARMGFPVDRDGVSLPLLLFLAKG